MRFIRRITVIIFVLALAFYGAVSVRMKMDEDTAMPVIESDRDVLQVSVDASEEDLLEGLTASDSHDGDLTGDIVVGSISKFVKKGTANVSYVVFDSNNNAGQFTRKVEYTDYVSPQFALSKSLDYRIGETVKVLDRLTASDVIDGDITDKIRIVSSDVDNTQAGIYTIGLELTNDYGDTVDQELLINVGSYPLNGPEITLSQYLLYVDKDAGFKPREYIASVMDGSGDAMDTDEVHVKSDVNTKIPGTYQVTYSIEDENEVEGITHMLVIVKE